MWISMVAVVLAIAFGLGAVIMESYEEARQ